MDNEARVQEILKRRGLDVTPVDNFTEADVPEPTERFTKLINIYYAMKNTVDMEIPYWYNRVWWENEGDSPCESLRCGPFPHDPHDLARRKAGHEQDQELARCVPLPLGGCFFL